MTALKALFAAFKTSYEKNIEDTQSLCQFIAVVNTLPQDIEADQSKFLFEELIPGVVKRCLSVATTKQIGYDLLISEMLESVTALFNKMLSPDGACSERLSDMADTMHLVFDNQQKFYLNHFLNDLAAQEVKHNFSKFSVEEMRWRQSLSVDTLVDAYKVDDNFKVSMWAAAKVSELIVDPKTSQITTVKLSFVNDISVNDVLLPIDSDKFAPYNSKREPDEWRAQLKKGDVVDALDRCSTWYEATVIEGEERLECLMPMIKVGFRQYHSTGPKSDDMGKYYGFSQVADEHIGSYTVRIQKPYTYSKKGNLKKSTDYV